MSFGQDMKDFVSAFKTGSDMVRGWQDSNAKDKYYDALTDAAKQKKDGDSDSFEKVTDRFNNAGATTTDNTSSGGAKSGGSVQPPEEIKKVIDANVPEEMRPYAYTMAMKESSFNPDAKSKTGATGLFQFTSGTGAKFGLNGPEGDKRTDALANTQAFVKLTNENRDYLTKKLGRAPTWSELAVAHQQGAQGAYNLITGTGSVNKRNMAVNNARGINDITKFYALPNTPATAPTQIAKPPTQAIPTAMRADATNSTEVEPDEEDDEDAYARGGMIRSYADGGPVTNDDPITEQSNNQYYTQEAARQQAQQPQQAIPMAPTATDGTPTPPPRPNLEGQQAVPTSNAPAPGATENSGNSPSLFDAIGSGLKAIQAKFTPQGAVPGQQGADGTAALFTTTQDAADHQDVREMVKKVDPDGKMPEGIARTYGMVKAYEYFVAKGDEKKAAGAVASIIRYSQIQAQTMGAAAVDALNKGDVEGAKKYLLDAYNQVPDGQHAALEGGEIVFRDMSGKVTQKMPAPGPGQVLQMAKAAQDGSGYYNMLLQQMGGRGRASTAKAPVPPSEAFQKYQQGGTQPGNPQPAPAPAAPAPTQETETPAPAPAAPVPTQVAENTQTKSDGAPEAAPIPKTFLKQPAAAAARPAPPAEPNYAKIADPKERAEAQRIYRDRYNKWKTENPAPKKGAEDEIDYEGTHKEVSKALDDYIEENTPTDPKAPPLDIKPKAKTAIRDIATHLRAHNENMTSERAIEVTMSMLTKNEDDPSKPNFEASPRAADGSQMVRLRDGDKLILSPDAANRLDRVIKARAKTDAAEKKTAEEARKNSPGARMAKGVDTFVDGVREKFSERNPAKDKIMQERRAKQQAFNDSARPTDTPGYDEDPSASEGPWNANSRRQAIPTVSSYRGPGDGSDRDTTRLKHDPDPSASEGPWNANSRRTNSSVPTMTQYRGPGDRSTDDPRYDRDPSDSEGPWARNSRRSAADDRKHSPDVPRYRGPGDGKRRTEALPISKADLADYRSTSRSARLTTDHEQRQKYRAEDTAKARDAQDREDAADYRRRRARAIPTR